MKHLALLLAACGAPPGSLEQALGAGDVQLEDGIYEVPVIPALRGAAGMTLHGSLRGRDGTVIRFVGDAAGHDWAGIVVTGLDPIVIDNVTLDGTGVTGANEHSPLIRVSGPATVEIAHSHFDYPADGKRGDCVSLIGQPGKDAHAHVHHNTFGSCARVGVQFHSNVIGEIDHNVFMDGGRAADLDGEGSGGNQLQIDHNYVAVGLHTTSVLALQIEADLGDRIHDNTFIGKAINIYGCAFCESHDNHVTLTMPTGAPVLQVTKASPGYYDHDNVYERAASAGPGFVVFVAQKLTAPSDVVFEHAWIAQHTPRAPIQSLGIQGMALRRTTVLYDGGVPVMAWDAEGISQRTTELALDHSTLIGPYIAALVVSSSYGGTGTVLVRDTIASAPLVCKGAVAGPVTYERNAMPAPQCGGLVP